MSRILSSVTKISQRLYSTKGLPTPQTSPKLPQLRPFINNEYVDALSGETFKSYNPTTGQVITEIQKSGKDDVDRAVAAAKDAFKINSEWRSMDASARGMLIFRLADLVERDHAYMASLEALDVGKVYSATVKGDLPWGIRVLRYFAGMADKQQGIVAPVDGNFIAYTRNEPVGVCGLITAWNFSTLMVMWKIGPALAAGCTSVVKASQHSTLAALHFGELIKEAGIPPGVINILPGQGDVGAMLVKHKDVDKISFTGSTPIGVDTFKNGASTMKRLVLELGGKSPNIILPDADVDKAVEHAHLAAFHNMGQCCCSGSRTFVHESMYEKFLEKSAARVKARKVGNPFDASTEHGPQATEQQMNIVLDYVEKGKQEGVRLLAGGEKIKGDGYFVQPTLFGDVTDDMAIAREEIFGPVQQVLSYKTIDEVIERANDSEYGLASSVFGNNMDQIHTILQALRTGSVWVNTYYQITPQAPFGGYKMSGIGREGSPYSLSSYQEVKSVYYRTADKNS